MTSLFFSYSHKDEELRNELEIHLTTLKRQGIINTWHDRRIVPGQEWASAISEHLEKAQVILLLISPYFIASDYCYDLEMKRAIERHEAGETKVIPVILEHCNWHGLPFGRLQATPKDEKPVSMFTNRHEALTEVTRSIQLAVASFATPNPKAATANERLDSATKIKTNSSSESINRQDVRSSNLRIKKTFTDYEKDQYMREAFEYMTKYFQNSLQELENRNPQIKVGFQRIDANSFEATVYADGKQCSKCGVRLETRNMGGQIVYNNGGIARNTYGQMLSVKEDGYSLYLSSNIYLSANKATELTYEGGAELFWGYLLEPLQS